MKICHQVLRFGISLVFLPIWLAAQNPVPNPGFENWSGSTPAGWFTTNQPGINAITQSSTAHSGASAMRGEVLDLGGFPFPPNATTGDFPVAGFPVSQRYTRLTGYYQFSPGAGGDGLLIDVGMMKDGAAIGGNSINIVNPASSYTQFSVDIAYGTGDIPDTCFISILIFNLTLPTIGSTFLADDLVLETGTPIEAGPGTLPDEFSLKQNYPNPFNPATTFEFTLPRSSEVRLVIYNQLGQKVAGVVNGRLPAGTHKIDWQAGDLPSGVYLFRLYAGEFTATRKFVLLK